jgi:hypothetical protein
LEILAQQGVVITPVPAENKLIINVDMTGLALCYDSDVSEVSESL